MSVHAWPMWRHKAYRDTETNAVKGRRTESKTALRDNYLDMHRRYVSPAQRHDRLDQGILAARREVYEQAKARHPARWSGQTRNWTPSEAVTLNPERDHVVSTALKEAQTQQIAA